MLKNIALAGAMLVALASTQARAALVEYRFSSDAAMTLSDGHKETISGEFVWDTTNGITVSDNITVAGPDLNLSVSASHAVFAVFFITGNNGINSQSFYHFSDSYGGTGFELEFANDLNLGANDPLSVFMGPPAFFPGIWVSGAYTEATSFTGEADVVPAPEPASLAVLSVGMAGLGAFRRRRADRHTA
jgi:hypothetical protein